jgi:hypothetical protein
MNTLANAAKSKISIYLKPTCTFLQFFWKKVQRKVRHEACMLQVAYVLQQGGSVAYTSLVLKCLRSKAKIT